jgi:chemotaxis response regulator CheB
MHQPQDQLGGHPDIVAIGASAGGVDVIPRLLSLLPSDLPASVLVVLHRPIEQISILRGILARKSNMHVTSLMKVTFCTMASAISASRTDISP